MLLIQRACDRRLIGEVLLDWQNHLHHRASALDDQAAHQRFVGSQPLRVHRRGVVVDGEVEEDEIGPAPQDVALQAERSQLRSRAADRRVPEREVGLRIKLLQALADQRAVRRQLRIGRARTPGEAAAEKSDAERLIATGAVVELGEIAAAGTRHVHAAPAQSNTSEKMAFLSSRIAP